MKFLSRLFGPPSIHRFASRIIQALREAGDPLHARYDAAEHRILRSRDNEVVGALNLGNMYGTYRQLPRARRPEFVRHCAHMALTTLKELPDEFDAARPDLRPRLWSRATLEQGRLRRLLGDDSGMADLPTEPIGEHLTLTLVYDWPESVQTIAAENLAGWDVTFYEAMEASRQNLEEATPGYVQLGDHLYAFTTGDSYDASRIALVQRIQDLAVAGKPVVMVPNRDALLVTGSDDEVGLTIMADLAAKGLQEAYDLSAIPLILQDETWIDWIPPADHSLRRQFRELELNWIGPLYFQQKKLLDAVHQQRGIDIFAPSFSAVQKQDGEQVSYCVWGEGVDSLLPMTQKVAFMQKDHEGPVALADWAQVVDVVGGLMEPTEHYPPRYRVRAFPDAAALAAIGLGKMYTGE